MSKLMRKPPVSGLGVAQCIFYLGRYAEARQIGDLGFEALTELLADDELLNMVESAVAPIENWRTKQFDNVFDFRLYRILLYIAVRTGKPKIAIETGVLHGMTTLFLLRAMEKTGRGRLISIDLPSYEDGGPSNKDGYYAILPRGKQPGWTVPAGRYPNWDLKLESSRDVLPRLSSEVGGIDFFLHDSEHTFSTMWFELDWAWEHLNPGGQLFCDNIEASTAFQDFAKRVGRSPLYFPAPDNNIHEAPRFGVIFK
jgi:predicted O-methyltransferase YrrM